MLRSHLRQRALDPVHAQLRRCLVEQHCGGLVEAPMAVDHQARVGTDGLAYRRDACEPSLHRTLTVTRRADVLRYFIERRELERHMAGCRWRRVRCPRSLPDYAQWCAG